MRLTLGTLNHSISLRTGLALTAAAGLAASGLAMASSADAATTHGLRTAHSCAASTKAGYMSCQAVKVTSGVSSLAKSSGAVDPKAAPSGYGPSDLQSAYSLPSSGGSGADRRHRRRVRRPERRVGPGDVPLQYGLPACTTANGCFQQGRPGRRRLRCPTADAGLGRGDRRSTSTWSAPSARTATSSWSRPTPRPWTTWAPRSTPRSSLGARFVSNSYGGGEASARQQLRQPRTSTTRAWPSRSAPATSGYGVEYPAASPYVTAVGGTSLTPTASARGWTETAGTAPAAAARPTTPSRRWQNDSGCGNRYGRRRLRGRRPGYRRGGLRHLRRPAAGWSSAAPASSSPDHRRGLRAGGHPVRRLDARRPSRTPTPARSTT